MSKFIIFISLLFCVVAVTMAVPIVNAKFQNPAIEAVREYIKSFYMYIYKQTFYLKLV